MALSGWNRKDSPHRLLTVNGKGAGEMIEAIKDLLNRSGQDGDFLQVGTQATHDLAEIDQILGAWTEERGRSVECLLLLGRVRRLLFRILTEGRTTNEDEREMKRLLRLIDFVERDSPASGC